MTLQQEAIQIINKMPEDRIRVIVELLHIMEPQAYGDNKEDRMEALRWMQRMHEEMPDDIYSDLDFDKEREKALTEKYGDFG